MNRLQKTYFLSKLLIALLILITNINAGSGQKLSANDFNSLEGYQVKFDYDNYPEERAMLYQFYLKEYGEDPDNPYPVSEDSFGVDLYDIDNDGEKEILAYLNNPYWCGSAGCGLYIFKKANNRLYYYKWSCTEKSYSSALTVYDNVKILKHVTNSYHDIAFGPEPSIWKWSGKCYEFFKKFNSDI